MIIYLAAAVDLHPTITFTRRVWPRGSLSTSTFVALSAA
jgi:hypothetical protein